MKNYILRKAEASDSELIYSIKKNALGEYIKITWGWNEKIQRRMHEEEMLTENISIIEYENAGIGTVSKRVSENEVIVCRLYIVDRFQSYGIGSDIIKKVIRENPDKVIRLGVLKVNSRARKLYESLGFEVFGEENEHYKMRYKKIKSKSL